MSKHVHPAEKEVRKILTKLINTTPVTIGEINYSELQYWVTFVRGGSRSQGRFLRSWIDDFHSSSEKEKEIKHEIARAFEALK